MSRSRLARYRCESLESRLLLSAWAFREMGLEQPWQTSLQISERSHRHQQGTGDFGSRPGTAAPVQSAGAVATASVVGRYIFYNGSVFDGYDPTANSLDDSAIATDKQPLLAGGLGQFANIVSTAAGITGIMVDISGVPVIPVLSDFNFSVGNSATPSQWAAAPAPSGM